MASQLNLHSKHHPGDGYNPEAFIDRADYDAELAQLQKDNDKKVKED